MSKLSKRMNVKNKKFRSKKYKKRSHRTKKHRKHIHKKYGGDNTDLDKLISTIEEKLYETKSKSEIVENLYKLKNLLDITFDIIKTNDTYVYFNYDKKENIKYNIIKSKDSKSYFENINKFYKNFYKAILYYKYFIVLYINIETEISKSKVFISDLENLFTRFTKIEFEEVSTGTIPTELKQNDNYTFEDILDNQYKYAFFGYELQFENLNEENNKYVVNSITLIEDIKKNIQKIKDKNLSEFENALGIAYKLCEDKIRIFEKTNEFINELTQAQNREKIELIQNFTKIIKDNKINFMDNFENKLTTLKRDINNFNNNLNKKDTILQNAIENSKKILVDRIDYILNIINKSDNLNLIREYTYEIYNTYLGISIDKPCNTKLYIDNSKNTDDYKQKEAQICSFTNYINVLLINNKLYIVKIEDTINDTQQIMEQKTLLFLLIEYYDLYITME